MHLTERAGNETSPLFSIGVVRRLRMVVDYDDNKTLLKDECTPPLPRYVARIAGYKERTRDDTVDK